MSGGQKLSPRQSAWLPKLRVNESSDEAELVWGNWTITAEIRATAWAGIAYQLVIRCYAGPDDGTGIVTKIETSIQNGTPEEAAEEALRWFGATFVAYSEHEEDGDDDLVPYRQTIDLRPIINAAVAQWRKASAGGLNSAADDDEGEPTEASTPLSLTEDQILARIHEVEDSDVFGAQRADLIGYLSFEKARPFLMPEVTKEMWVPNAFTREQVIAEMRQYMGFAIGKAEDERGLSAPRSIDHFRAWLWLLGDVEMLRFADDGDNYPMYGKPILRRICEKYGFEWSAS